MRPRAFAIRQDNNGDVLLAGPALRALATRFEVILVCGPSGEPAARLLPHVAAVEVFRADWIEANPQPLTRAHADGFIALAQRLAPSDAFVFTSFHQSPLPMALLLRLAGVPRIHAISVDYPGSLLDTRLNVPDDIHEVTRALRLAAAAGAHLPPGDDGGLRLCALPATGHLASGDYIAVQPGATVPARTWAPAKWRALVRELSARGRRVAVVGSANERELCAFVAGDTAALDLSGRTTFAQFAGVVAGARALVVGNTSGVHVASATGTPVVTVFPPTIPPVRFAPWRVDHVRLGDDGIACAGCRARACPVPQQPCIGALDAGDVIGALRALNVLSASASRADAALTEVSL